MTVSHPFRLAYDYNKDLYCIGAGSISLLMASVTELEARCRSNQQENLFIHGFKDRHRTVSSFKNPVQLFRKVIQETDKMMECVPMERNPETSFTTPLVFLSWSEASRVAFCGEF